VNPALAHPLRYWRWQRARRRSEAAWPAPGFPVAESPLLAIDLEMTGLDPIADDIVSIGWVPINAGVIDLSGAREYRLPRQTARSVGQSATIHGLRDCDLDEATDGKTALEALLEALSGRIAVFHHAPLDLGFLERALRTHGLPGWGFPVIDTLAWQRRRLRLSGYDGHYPGRMTLEASCRAQRLVVRQGHSALADALSCAELLLAVSKQGRATLLEVARPHASRA